MTISSDLKEVVGELIGVLCVLRRTSPDHLLSKDEKEEVIKSLDKALTFLDKIKEEIKNKDTQRKAREIQGA